MGWFDYNPRIGDWTVESFKTYMDGKFDQLTFEEPARWALLLEKYFAIRKDEEGLMLAQAISKKLAKKKTRRKKEKVSDEPIQS